ncbi:MAG TPA: PDZ domain-containing protein, partial [Candidatus Bathyarchaeota archaeon]|nr:PDZ domain-containing protein [Candidatus Bathyarchaeota archaeon]
MDETLTYVKVSSLILILIFAAGMVSGGIISYLITYQQINELESKVSNLNARVSALYGYQNITNQYIEIYQNETWLAEIYEEVKDSVVLIRVTLKGGGLVQGSGFVYDYSGFSYSGPVIITNYHVVHEFVSDNALSLSVTFANGNGYAAEVKGIDPYADLAILIVNDAPPQEFKPLQLVNSSTLKVGDPVIAIGNPFGLVGSMTTGIVSALGRSISEEYTGGFVIPNVIQTSAPINPGNSGGPLLNCLGKVVGVTTAIVADSQGVGFAIPSNTILREIYALVENGTYTGHSYLGVKGTDMTYEQAQELSVNITWGWRIREVIPDGPASKANPPLQENDIIIAINGTKIKNGDELASYLEEKTLPGDIIEITIQRGKDRLKTYV